MKVKRISFKILVVILILTMLPIIGNISIAKEANEDKSLKIQYKRHSDTEEYGYGYALNLSGDSTHHPVFQIVGDEEGRATYNYYCLNATEGETWMELTEENGNVVTDRNVNYRLYYDLKDESDLTELKASDDIFGKLASSNYFKQVLWILKNMYVPTGNAETDKANREKLLEAAGIKYSAFEQNSLGSIYGDDSAEIVYGYKYVKPEGFENYLEENNNAISDKGKASNGWYYYSTEHQFTSVLMPDELIEVAQQLAIWYYINYLDAAEPKNEEYNVRENGVSLLCSTDAATPLTQWQPLSGQFKEETDVENVTADKGSWYEDQATILCWYLIDAAQAATSQETGIPLQITIPADGKKLAEPEEQNINGTSYYVVGPIKIDETSVAPYTIYDLSNTIKVNDKDNVNYLIGSSLEMTGATKGDFKSHLNDEDKANGFYLGIPKSDVGDAKEITIEFDGTYRNNNVTLWKDAQGKEQPVAEVEPNDEEFPLKVSTKEPVVDLALTKFITAVSEDDTINDGEYITADKHIGNENNRYLREASVDTTPLKNYKGLEGEKHDAVYTMDKSPLLVPKEAYVLYNIRVYNEGGQDVYAGEIEDQLPDNLEFVEGTFNTGYGWVLQDDQKTVKTNYLSHSRDHENNLLKAFNKNADDGKGSELDYRDVPILCKVSKSAPEKTNLVNTAEISKYEDKDGNNLDKDLDSVPHNRTDKNQEKRQEDDDDWERVYVQDMVDLALTKFITAVSEDDTINDGEYITADKHIGNENNRYLREASIDTTPLKNYKGLEGETHDAVYTMVKTPLEVPEEAYVLYNIRVYNEGDTDVYAGEIEDQLPDNLEFVEGAFNTGYGWVLQEDQKTVKTNYLSYEKGADKNLLKAFDKNADDGKGSELDYRDVPILCKVSKSAPSDTNLVNTAEISKYENKDGNNLEEDIDSMPHNRTDKNQEKRQEDDDDWERVYVHKGDVDLALKKFITAISEDDTIEDGEYVTIDGHEGSKENPYLREASVDTTPLKTWTPDSETHDAAYTMDKTPLEVPEEAYVLYNIRVYNEGDTDVYAGEIEDQLPDNLEFVECEFNTGYGWVLQEDQKTIKTDYLSYEKGAEKNLLKAFDKEKDDGKGSELDYRDVPILCKVSKSAPANTKLINTAEVSKYQDKDGNNLEEDIDSMPHNRTDKNQEKRQEDDDDWEVVYVHKGDVDLALTKFITAVSEDDTIEDGEYVTVDGHEGSKENPYLREASIDTTPLKNYKGLEGEKHDAVYTMDKTPLEVPEEAYVLYNIRVYNEGDTDVYAGEIEDQLPDNLEFVECEFNTGYGWVLQEDQKTVKTNYLSYEKGAENNLLKAFDKEKDDGKGSELDYRDVPILCKVSKSAPANTKLINTAEVSKYQDENGNDLEEDIDSMPHNRTDKNQEKRQEDDDDWEVVYVHKGDVDLALTKFITTVSEDDTIEDGEYVTVDGHEGSKENPYLREASVNTTPLKNYTGVDGETHDAVYTMDKTPLEVPEEAYVLYNIRVYNEGDTDVYAGEIEDQLPDNLEFVECEFNTGYGWVLQEDQKTVKTDYLSYEKGADKNLLKAFDKEADDGKGSGLDYRDVPILCKVSKSAPANTNLVNTAEVSKYQDKDGNDLEEDIDSMPHNRTDKNQEKRQEDDDDWEVVFIHKDEVDLALTKFITAVSADTEIEDGEYITADKHIGSKENPYLRATSVDTTPLKTWTPDSETHDAVYTMVKTPLEVPEEAYVLYNIRVYNEGDTDVYAGEIEDQLPDNLEFVECEFNTGYGWVLQEDQKTVKTDYLSYEKGADKNLLKAFDKEADDGKGSGLDYRDVPILCKVSKSAPSNTNLVNTAEISKYEDENGNDLEEDIDSMPHNRTDKNQEKRQEDDDDWEVVYVHKEEVDLALTKFITAVSADAEIEDGEYITADKHIGSKENPYLRATSVDTTPLKTWTPDSETHDAIYTMDKTPLLVPRSSYVLYNIRVYNEGDTDVYAGEIKDHLPEYLDYVDCEYNKVYGWVLQSDGKTVITDYLSYEADAENNLMKAFDKEADDGRGSGLDYRDIQILCRVNENAPTGKALANVAEVSKYEDDNGNEIPEDKDSIPNNVDEKDEDDDDYEGVLVQTFDLSLLKWVSTVYVTEDGVTKTTKTGNTGNDATDTIPKVEINRKKIDSTVVKFEYTIKVTNEGDIAGYAKEITDYVPEGLKFYEEDNKGWTDEGNNVISTRLLEDTLLEPGESATVTVVLRWINGKENLNLKTNIAEISEDDNEYKVPDIDSIPDNRKDDEDDLDKAGVLLAISTGISGKIIQIGTGSSLIIAILSAGIILIKKYIL